MWLDATVCRGLWGHLRRPSIVTCTVTMTPPAAVVRAERTFLRPEREATSSVEVLPGRLVLSTAGTNPLAQGTLPQPSGVRTGRCPAPTVPRGSSLLGDEGCSQVTQANG